MGNWAPSCRTLQTIGWPSSACLVHLKEYDMQGESGDDRLIFIAADKMEQTDAVRYELRVDGTGFQQEHAGTAKWMNDGHLPMTGKNVLWAITAPGVITIRTSTHTMGIAEAEEVLGYLCINTRPSRPSSWFGRQPLWNLKPNHSYWIQDRSEKYTYTNNTLSSPGSINVYQYKGRGLYMIDPYARSASFSHADFSHPDNPDGYSKYSAAYVTPFGTIVLTPTVIHNPDYMHHIGCLHPPSPQSSLRSSMRSTYDFGEETQGGGRKKRRRIVRSRRRRRRRYQGKRTTRLI